MTTYPDRLALLAWQDARVHRCDACGTWIFAAAPCGTCRLALIRTPWPREDNAA